MAGPAYDGLMSPGILKSDKQEKVKQRRHTAQHAISPEGLCQRR